MAIWFANRASAALGVAQVASAIAEYADFFHTVLALVASDAAAR